MQFAPSLFAENLDVVCQRLVTRGFAGVAQSYLTNIFLLNQVLDPLLSVARSVAVFADGYYDR